MVAATVVLFVALSAAPNAAPKKLGVPSLRVVGMDAAFADVLTEQMAQRLSSHGFAVVTSRDMASLMGLEQQKQLLGCSEKSQSCMVELANALGVDGLVTGELAKLGKSVTLTVRALDTANGKRLAEFSETVQSEDELPDVMRRAGDRIAEALADQGSAPSHPLRTWSFIPAVVAAGGVVGGIVFRSSAQAHYDAIGPGAGLTSTALAQHVQDGKTAQSLELASFAVAGAALVGAGTMFFWPGAEAPPASVAVIPTREGVHAAVRFDFE